MRSKRRVAVPLWYNISGVAGILNDAVGERAAIVDLLLDFVVEVAQGAGSGIGPCVLWVGGADGRNEKPSTEYQFAAA